MFCIFKRQCIRQPVKLWLLWYLMMVAQNGHAFLPVTPPRTIGLSSYSGLSQGQEKVQSDSVALAFSDKEQPHIFGAHLGWEGDELVWLKTCCVLCSIYFNRDSALMQTRSMPNFLMHIKRFWQKNNLLLFFYVTLATEMRYFSQITLPLYNPFCLFTAQSVIYLPVISNQQKIKSINTI